MNRPLQHKREKRRYPRIEKKLPLKIAVDGYDFATTTKNVSCIGAYCHIDKYVPPFTKVAVRMTLSIMDRRHQPKDYNIDCKGVIVRTEDDEKGGFNIAIFFNKLKDRPQKKISQYINQFLPKNSFLKKL